MSEQKKTYLRYFCAAMAGLVSTLLGYTQAFAQNAPDAPPPCSSADYTNYLSDLETVPIEGTPIEYLGLSEDYLQRCAKRPEAGRVALRAARHALDSGNGEKALSYFDMARARYASFRQQNRLDYITALIVNGQADLAWSLRDEEIQLWLDKLEHDGLADIETLRLRDGLVYKVTYDAVDPTRRETVAWFAAPFEAGFPAMISLSSEDAMVGLAKIRYGEAGAGLKQIKLRRCHGVKTISSQIQGITEEAAHNIAMKAAKAYLAAPDGVAASQQGRPIATCFNVDRLFIAPDPETAQTLY